MAVELKNMKNQSEYEVKHIRQDVEKWLDKVPHGWGSEFAGCCMGTSIFQAQLYFGRVAEFIKAWARSGGLIAPGRGKAHHGSHWFCNKIKFPLLTLVEVQHWHYADVLGDSPQKRAEGGERFAALKNAIVPGMKNCVSAIWEEMDSSRPSSTTIVMPFVMLWWYEV